MVWYDMMWCDVMWWYDMMWCDMIWYDMTWYVVWCHVMSYHVMWCDVIWYHMIYHVMSCHVMSCHVISYHIISYHIISYHIVSYLISLVNVTPRDANRSLATAPISDCRRNVLETVEILCGTKGPTRWDLNPHPTYTPSQLAKFMGPTWGPPGSCRPQMGPVLAPWTMLSGLCCAQDGTYCGISWWGSPY